MKKIIFTLISSLAFFGSCATNIKTEKMLISAKKVDCVGVAPMKCMLVKNDKNSEWSYFYQNIEGFNYQEGNEYELIVEKIPVQESSYI